jgi:hypothetical protein
MRIIRNLVLSASLVTMGCGSDGSTGPTSSPQFETRLSAAATAPTTPISGQMLTLNVAVTNTLAEAVSGGICATTVQARRESTTWVDVTSSVAVCTAQAVVVPAGATVMFLANADPARVRTVLGGPTGTVIFRVQHTLAGDTRSYTLQSNEVRWTVN